MADGGGWTDSGVGVTAFGCSASLDLVVTSILAVIIIAIPLRLLRRALRDLRNRWSQSRQLERLARDNLYRGGERE